MTGTTDLPYGVGGSRIREAQGKTLDGVEAVEGSKRGIVGPLVKKRYISKNQGDWEVSAVCLQRQALCS